MHLCLKDFQTMRVAFIVMQYCDGNILNKAMVDNN